MNILNHHISKKVGGALFIALFAWMPLLSQAQTAEEPTNQTEPATPLVTFGYLSYDAALKSMPDYAAAQDSVRLLTEAFDKESKRVEAEFNAKYETFLEGQKDFPRTILLKRQNELQELMQRNVEFKVQARRELQEAEARLMQPVRDRLNAALAEIALESGFAVVINTDANACPFINPLMGKNIQQEVIDYLK